MKLRARNYVWWPGINEQLELLACECPQCLVTRNSPALLEDSKWPTPDAPWERLHADFAGPVDPGRKMLLVLADPSTKWAEICVMDTTTSERTIEAHQTLFARFGIPSTYGLAERFVQTVKKALKKMKNEPGSLQSKLSKFLFNYRNTPHPSTGEPPAVLIIGRLLHSHLDLLRPEADSRSSDVVPVAFKQQQTVMVRDYRPGKRWLRVVIERRIGSFLYLVRVGNQVIKRHVDQILPLRTNPQPEELPNHQHVSSFNAATFDEGTRISEYSSSAIRTGGGH